MDLTDLTLSQWALAFGAALTVGISKSGFGGVGMLTVILIAAVMPGHELESTGVVLPMLIIADLIAIRSFRSHAQWTYIIRLLPPALLGITLGYLWMRNLTDANFKPLIGGMVLGLSALQLFKQSAPNLFNKAPHTRPFAFAVGTTAGITTMLANAAGPVMSLYFLALKLPKMAFVGTLAWYFFFINVTKVPFSAHMGLITPNTLLFNFLLTPVILLGFFAGKAMLHRINQTTFERLLLILVIISALHLIFS